MQNIFFTIIASITIISALLMITIKNTFRSVILFMVTLLGFAGLYLLLQAEFVAFMQILVYVGAVVVLTIFVIMLTQDIASIKLKKSTHKKGIILIFTAIFLALLVKILINTPNQKPATSLNNEIAEIGKLFLTKYALPFEVVSILLLSVLIGAIVIAKEEKINVDSPTMPMTGSAPGDKIAKSSKKTLKFF